MDSALGGRLDRPGGGPYARTVFAPAAMPFFSPSMAMLEAVVRRAREQASGAPAAAVPVLRIPAPLELDTVHVRWLRPDSAVVVLHGGEVRLRVDAVGRVLGGGDAGFAIVRGR